jgi:hydroxymethylpyrimidine pyrophosphatase-like HAD family hydrolase
MGHAKPEIRALADYVTSDVPGQGVIDVLDRLYT